MRSGCVPITRHMNAEESQNCCALHFSSQGSPKSSPEVQAGTRVTFWECAKLSCTCEPNYLYDDLTVALRGCSFPRADKSVGGGKLVFSFGWFNLGRCNRKFDDYLDLEVFVSSPPVVKVQNRNRLGCGFLSLTPHPSLPFALALLLAALSLLSGTPFKVPTHTYALKQRSRTYPQTYGTFQ